MKSKDQSGKSLVKHQLDSASLTRNRLMGMVLMVLLLTLPLIVTQPADAWANRYRIRINNDSRYDIYRIYASSAERPGWGGDLLGRHRILASDDSFTITDIVPGEWDIKFVDEDGDECTLRNVQVFENLTWSITTNWLVRCQRSERCSCPIR